MGCTRKRISVKLLVDSERSRVVFAECGNDLVDVIFSFFTLPMGTIMRLLREECKMGSMSMLYESVDDLKTKFLQTEKCRNMLLLPQSNAKKLYRKLMVNLDNTEDTKPPQYYVCLNCVFKSKDGTYRGASTDRKFSCGCGEKMEVLLPERSERNQNDEGNVNEGVFVKESMTYMITDDLQVFPVSTLTSWVVLNSLGITDRTTLEERSVDIGEKEVLHLLKCIFTPSKTTLSDTFLGNKDTIDNQYLLPSLSPSLNGMAQSQTESRTLMSIKLIQSKFNREILYAEASEEFADLLFSFLTFPIGYILNCLGGGRSGIGCFENLYKSIEDFYVKGIMKSEKCKTLLLAPKLPPFYNTKNQLLQIEEEVPKPLFSIRNCYPCFSFHYYPYSSERCKHGIGCRTHLHPINPKFPNAVKGSGGSFLKAPGTFMVTDELVVKPLSPISGVTLVSKSNIPFSDLEERTVNVDAEKALALLKASFISKTVLTDVFSRRSDDAETMVSAFKCVKTEI